MSVCSMGRIPGGYITNHVYSWVDPEGQSISPPPDSQDANQEQGHCMAERTVNLNMDDGRSLGLMIRGGAEYGLGVYITGVDPGSAADAGALKVGDQILEVNGQSFVTISHDEAVYILKTGCHLLMKVRDVGRLPHARTMVDETKWICSRSPAESDAAANGGSVSNNTVNTGQRGSVSPWSSRPSSAKVTPVLGQPVYRGVAPPGSQVSLEQQAYMLLTEPERRTMTYYLQEYQEGHIGAEPLVMALFELFNTHAKLSMLSEVRSLVAPQDLDLYDRLVLHRERETHQTWHGGLGVLHPQGPCNHSTPVVNDAGHSLPATTEGPYGGWAHKNQEDNTYTLQHIAVAPGGSPPCFRATPLQGHSRRTTEKEQSRKSSARRMQSGSSLLFSGPAWLLQDCLHKSLKSLPTSHQPSSDHHTSLNALQSSEDQNHPHFHHSRPNSGHHTCPGFLHHRESSHSPRPETSVKLASRSSSYEKSSYLSKSASSSKAASPMPSPHLSPHLSPCPSPCPSLIIPAAPPCSPDWPCSPGLTHKVIITDMNRLSADSRLQQRGASLSQLSDGGQTLSEDSGVDIETGGASKDGSPRPSKTQQGHLDKTGPLVPPGTRQTGSPVPVPTATLVQVVKNTSTLGIAIEGGANTRQPLPRIVTIQRGGSAHNGGQLKVGQVILEVNGIPLRGREHRDAAQIIAEAFKTKDQDHINFVVVEPGL